MTTTTTKRRNISLVVSYAVIATIKSTAFVTIRPPITTGVISPRTKIPHPTIHDITTTTTTTTHSSLLPPLLSTTTTTTTPPRTTTTTKPRSRPKKSVRDRTPSETRDLIRDIMEATIDAGPRAGPQRTFEAYRAIIATVRDFSPFVLRVDGSTAETFSAPKALRKIFERLGATYIKLGQFIASSPTLFPPEYVLEFQKCLDQTEPVPWGSIKKVIEAELGPIPKTFSSIDQTPLASASIAQVHAATLLDGTSVVLKIQKPTISSSLRADLSFIFVASRLVEFLQPDFERTSLAAIASDVRSSMLDELDFEKEARNVEEFRAFLGQQGLAGVATAPKVFRDYTTKKVMTMERLYGVSLLEGEKLSSLLTSSRTAAATTTTPEDLIITALNVWTTSVMTMPWFHADVHAGNLLVLEDGRVGFIDFGIVGKVSEKTFEAVNSLSGALALGDYEGMAQALCDMGAADEEVDVKAFGSDIEKVMVRMMGVQPEVTVGVGVDGSVSAASVGFDETELTQLVLDFVDVAEGNGLKLPREFGLLVKQSLYFDRYLKILAPGLDVMGDERVSGLGGAAAAAAAAAGDGDKMVVNGYGNRDGGKVQSNDVIDV